MRYAISNIAWSPGDDAAMAAVLGNIGWALEVAPTRIVPEAPYDNIRQAKSWMREAATPIVSMQSIWYGRQENMFNSAAERQALADYTKKAVDFASALGCRNLVFGCPRNRDCEPSPRTDAQALDFLREVGDYAAEHGSVISIEANPPIYNTRFVNTTEQAAELAKRVDNPGIGINLDLGTMVYNGESASIIPEIMDLISHVHISEPYLKPIERRELHRQVLAALNEGHYRHYVSIEMGNTNNLKTVLEKIGYVVDLDKTL